MISSVEKIYVDGNFENYRVTFENGKISNVPLDEANTDYQAVQEWAAIEGNNIIDPGA
jgi:hypothetical protein